jgi:hypothetical protein
LYHDAFLFLFFFRNMEVTPPGPPWERAPARPRKKWCLKKTPFHKIVHVSRSLHNG